MQLEIHGESVGVEAEETALENCSVEAEEPAVENCSVEDEDPAVEHSSVEAEALAFANCSVEAEEPALLNCSGEPEEPAVENCSDLIGGQRSNAQVLKRVRIGLLASNSRYTGDFGADCDEQDGARADFREYRHLLTFIFAIKDINNNPSILPNITLGYHLYDSCGNVNKVLKDVLQILSGHSVTAPNYSCMDHDNVAGYIGDQGSATTLPMAQLLAIPIVKIPLLPELEAINSLLHTPIAYRCGAVYRQGARTDALALITLEDDLFE
ncbi:unnamed protein product [Ranitomeya imitator]|uniref:Receptor ligand binding region domain-containing protein n=1 Tax=Ranitomeya imitator TaxID=111125 RepID=A0ABN9MG75_9NEOB|nr:unnamed protein product [Ranitomeya imitator]